MQYSAMVREHDTKTSFTVIMVNNFVTVLRLFVQLGTTRPMPGYDRDERH